MQKSHYLLLSVSVSWRANPVFINVEVRQRLLGGVQERVRGIECPHLGFHPMHREGQDVKLTSISLTRAG